jgi:hypothetical protein
MLNSRLTDGPVRWTHNLSSARRTRTTASPAKRGDTIVTQRDQGLRCIEAPSNTTRNTTEELHGITTQYTASDEVAQLHPALSNSREAPPEVATHGIGEGPRAARASNVFRRPQPRPMTTEATTSKWAALAWCASRLPQAAVRIWHGHPWTTWRSSCRRLVQTTPTSSITSLGTVT